MLGQGGMGSVYLAKQLSLGRLVAIKILPPHLAANGAYVQRFRQEAKAAARLNHINLVQVFDAGEDEGQFFFVMEYVNGETAGQRLKRKKRLDEESTLLLGEAVAVALEYGWNHAALVHRDIKPDNILIDADGTVKVADLGLAKMFDKSDPEITVAKMMIGTPHYCSPEQARGESELDCRADIYALGATLYHLVTGDAPFAETSGVAAMVRNITDYIADPMDMNAEVSPYFAMLVEKMMAKNKHSRQRTWDAVLDDIDRVMHKYPPLSEPVAEGESTVRRSIRRVQPTRMVIMEDSAPSAAIDRPGETIRAAERRVRPKKKTTSRVFRMFLITAAVVTVLLSAVWVDRNADQLPAGMKARVVAVDRTARKALSHARQEVRRLWNGHQL